MSIICAASKCNKSTLYALLDSGASVCMFGDAKFFVPGSLRPTYKVIKCADGKYLYAYFEGLVIITKNPKLPPLPDNVIVCRNALLVDGIATSLISVPQLDDDYSFKFSKGRCIVKSPPITSEHNKRKIIYKLQKNRKHDSLYHLPFYVVHTFSGSISKHLQCNSGSVDLLATYSSANIAKVDHMDVDLAHLIYNHAPTPVLVRLFPHLKGKQLSFCDSCALNLKNKGYSKRTSAPTVVGKINSYLPKFSAAADRPLDTCTVDVDGVADVGVTLLDGKDDGLFTSTRSYSTVKVDVEPRSDRTINADKPPFSDIAMDAFTSPTISVRNLKYAFVVVDTVSRIVYPFLTSTREEVKGEYIFWAKHIYNKTGRYPAYVRVDQAGEFLSGDMRDFFTACGSKVSSSTTKQSNQNSFAERVIGVLWHKTKVVLTQSGLPLTYWCYAFAYVAVVYNHLPHRSLDFQRPVDVAGFRPVDGLLRPFGCESYHLLPTKTKSDLAGHRSLFLGFDDVRRGYFFLDLTTKKVVSSRTAIFRYRSFPMLHANRGVPLPIDIITWPSPTMIKRQEERGGSLFCPPNTLSVDPDLLEMSDAVWDEATSPPSTVFDEPNNALPPSQLTQQSSKSKLSNITSWIKGKLSTGTNTIVEPNDSTLGELSPIQASGQPKKFLEPPFLPSVKSVQTSHEDPKDTKEEEQYYIGNQQAWEVEDILSHKSHGRGFRLLVKWKGYEEPDWQPRKEMMKVKATADLVDKYFSTLDTKRCLENDFESISGLDKKARSKVLQKFSMPSKLKPLDEEPELTATTKSLSISSPTTPTIDVSDKKDKSDKTEKEVPGLSESSPIINDNPNKVPIFHDITPDTQKILIGNKIDEIEANLTATKVPLPPDYSGHMHYTENELDLNDIINYAFLSKQGVDIFDAIQQDSSLELPPKTQKTMLEGKRCDEYIEAEERELAGIIKHGTWEVVIKPKDRNCITCRWVYDIKRDNNNNTTLYKARLVVHGYKQVEGVDYSKTFSSTAQMRSFRTIVMLAIAFDLDLHQYDISNAFLNGKLEEEIYMDFPPGYPGAPGTCLKLLKGLYGLKQAARIWNKALIKVLKKAGLKVCDTEPGVLYHPDSFCLVCLHVDDIIICTADKTLRAKIEKLLSENFLVKNLGQLSTYVGVEIYRAKDSITMKQSAYSRRVIERFKKYMSKFKSKTSNKTPNFADKLSKTDVPVTPDEEILEYPFPSVVGSLMYLVVASRPDMAQPVIQLARFMAGWGETHIKAANKALKYLANTTSDGITFTKPPNFNGKLKILCFSDSDWAGCPDTRRSTLGYTILICGGPISWKSQLMKTLAHSSCEAEYMVLSEIGREIIWLCNFFDEIGIEYETPQIFCDSSSAIDWADDPVQHQRTKHVEIDYYYIRKIVANKKVELYKIDTKENLADVFTKNVDTATFELLKPFIMGWQRINIEIE